jgi:hypothetical protein
VRTSASSKLSRARKDNFCHIALVHHRGPLTDKKGGYLIEPYSNYGRDA